MGVGALATGCSQDNILKGPGFRTCKYDMILKLSPHADLANPVNSSIARSSRDCKVVYERDVSREDIRRGFGGPRRTEEVT